MLTSSQKSDSIIFLDTIAIVFQRIIGDAIAISMFYKPLYLDKFYTFFAKDFFSSNTLYAKLEVLLVMKIWIYKRYKIDYIEKRVTALAKETRLTDDAQIYQPRDTRSEKEKFQSMNRKEKIQYFNQYYLGKMLVGIVVVCFIGYIIYSFVKPKVVTALYTAVLDGCIDVETTSSFESDMTERLGLDTKESIVMFDNSYYITSNSSYSSSNIEKLVVYIAAGDVDVMIGPETTMNQYALAGYFSKMSECLPTDLFSTLTDNFYYSTTDEDDENAPYGIYLDEYAIRDDNGEPIMRPVLAIVANSKYKDNAVIFIESLDLD